MVRTASQGRDIAVDGRETASDIGGVFAEELGLPPFAVTTEHASDRGRKAAWSADGWIDVCPLGPGSDFRYKLGIDLFHAPIPVERFAVLAERHGPTIA